MAVCIRIEEKGIGEEEFAIIAQYKGCSDVIPFHLPMLIENIDIYEQRIPHADMDYYKSLLNSILSEIVDCPVILSQKEQGSFIVGYYHQLAELDKYEVNFKSLVE